MPNVFIASDHHFGHSNILTFKKSDGSLLRPGFKDADHMAEVMIERHNSVVRPQDKVYFLGDFAMKDKGIAYAARMNGHKRILLGNHDYSNMRLYQPYFEAIYSSRMLDKILFTHIPIHPGSIGKCWANAHGHCHSLPQMSLGPLYYNVCVEMIGYAPISLEDLKKKIKKQQESNTNWKEVKLDQNQ